MRVCSVEGCTHRADGYGYCQNHYRRYRRFGDPLADYPPRTTGVCDLPGCGKPHDARGWCHQHYQGWVATGDPLRSRSPEVRADLQRALAAHAAGDVAGVVQWIKRAESHGQALSRAQLDVVRALTGGKSTGRRATRVAGTLERVADLTARGIPSREVALHLGVDLRTVVRYRARLKVAA